MYIYIHIAKNIYTHKTIFIAYCTQVYLIGHPSSIFNLYSTAMIEETILLLEQVLKALNMGCLFNNHLPRAGYMSGVTVLLWGICKVSKIEC